jgi:hypothetical protein
VNAYSECETNRELLAQCLAVTVPLWIEHHRAHGPAFRAWRARYCTRVVSERGDVLLFRTKKAGAAGEVFNRLAEGLALATLETGEVDAYGLHFKART